MTPQELKSSILQLAIQGRLVEQRPEEGTAEELFKEILEEKINGLCKKKLSISDDEIPFDIPETWKWIRVNNIAVLYNGRAYSKKELKERGKYPILRVGNLFTSHQWYFSDLELEDEKYCQAGDLLYAWSASFGPRIWDGCKVIYHYHIWKIVHSSFVFQKYLYYYLLADTERIKQSGHGLAMIHVTKAGTEQRLVPLPPLAEQKRIVAKIEELLPYIDRYEKAWSKLEDFNKRFPGDMQKSVLQMAIQGKLVPQLPEEGSADELYQQIQSEKQQLIKKGKIKKEKYFPEKTEDEFPFDIPEGWKWLKLEELLLVQPSNGLSPKGVDYQTQYRNLTLTATTSGIFKPDAFKYVDITEKAAEKYYLKDEDILIQRSNSRELVGTSCIYRHGDNLFIYPDLMMRIHLFEGINVDYIDYVLKSPHCRSYYQKSASGTSTSMPKINQSIVKRTMIPLPPLAEQKRIVQKLEEILPLCERLR